MNLTFILGIVGGFILLVLGMSIGGEPTIGPFDFTQLANFGDAASIFIVFGGTLESIIAGIPCKMIA